MKVQPSPRAAASIRAIIDFYRAHDPRAAEAFKKDLQRCRRTLREHPESGEAIGISDARVSLTPRFRYVVYYRIVDNAVVLADVQHPARARPVTPP